jgi:hemerythrin-like domain-containing protein
MYYEHEVGRSHVRTMGALAADAAPVDASASGALLTCADAYIPLLRQHILTEDNILYPMALRVLTGPELDAMNADFETFEAVMRGDGTYDRLQALAEQLGSRYRPDPIRMERASQLAHCGR